MISMTPEAAAGRGVIWGLFLWGRGCQGEESSKCSEKRSLCLPIILSTDIGKIGLILNFRHQPVFEGDIVDP